MDNYLVKGGSPDMTEEAFLRVLREAGSPVSAGEARQVYSYALARGLSVAFLLAMFRKESTFGRFGSATVTHSWGNTRPPSFGVPHEGVTERNFSRYANWTDGGVSTIARLFDHAPYHGKDTVKSIIPVWAPTSENDTAKYIADVLASIEQYATPQESSIRIAIRDATNWNGPNRPNAPLTGGRARKLTIHETANPSVGANAEMHRKFVQNGGGTERVSFHYVVDDHEAVRLLTDTERGVHAGDATGNATSIAIETCVNSDGDFAKARRNLTLLAAQILHANGLTPADVVPHQFWSGKTCPRQMLTTGEWAGQLAAIEVAYRALTAPPADPANWTVTQTAEGNTVLTINFGGTATKTLGVNIVDVGVSVENAAGEVYDRSVQGGVFGAWRRRT